jgi:hypothetical protein
MERVICTKDMDAKARRILVESVKQVVQNNKEVFDELAKK